MLKPLSVPALSLAALLAVSAPACAQNADAGKAVFRANCAACHLILPNKMLVGPSLFGVFGRKTGTVPGFAYSAANRNANLTWDEPTLDRYLTAPRDVVPGTKMTFGGLADADKRHDLIAYLETLK